MPQLTYYCMTFAIADNAPGFAPPRYPNGGPNEDCNVLHVHGAVTALRSVQTTTNRRPFFEKTGRT